MTAVIRCAPRRVTSRRGSNRTGTLPAFEMAPAAWLCRDWLRQACPMHCMISFGSYLCRSMQKRAWLERAFLKRRVFGRARALWLVTRVVGSLPKQSVGCRALLGVGVVVRHRATIQAWDLFGTGWERNQILQVRALQSALLVPGGGAAGRAKCACQSWGLDTALLAPSSPAIALPPICVYPT
jgi:hypothetical protein